MKVLHTCALLAGAVAAAAGAQQPSGFPTHRRELQWGGGGNSGGGSKTSPPTAPEALAATIERSGWSLELTESAPESNVFNFKLTVEANTWVSVALAAKKVDGVNRMHDAIAVVYEAEESTPIRTVKMEKISSAKFEPVSINNTVSNVKGEQSGGKTILTFTAASAFGSLPLKVGADSELLVAFGDEGTNTLTYHGSESRSIVPFFQSGGSGTALPMVISLHIIFMLVAWGMLVPAGVVSALLRNTNPPSPAWFNRHRGFVISGVILGMIGSGLVINKKISDGTGHTDKHFIVGLAVLALSIVNVLLGLGRPHAAEPGEEKSSARATWEILHRSVGSTALLLGLLNLVFGALLVFLSPAASESYSFFDGAAGAVGSGSFGGFLIAVPVLALIAVCYAGYKKSVATKEDEKVLSSLA